MEYTPAPGFPENPVVGFGAENIAVEFAEKIKRLRAERSWSQKDLAEAAGVTKLMISKYETGRCAPNLENVGKLARVLGVTTDYLIYDSVPRNGKVEVRDVDLYERLQAAQDLPDEDRAVLKHVIEGLAARRQMDQFAQDLARTRRHKP